jgi:hypothetical protein
MESRFAFTCDSQVGKPEIKKGCQPTPIAGSPDEYRPSSIDIYVSHRNYVLKENVKSQVRNQRTAYSV